MTPRALEFGMTRGEILEVVGMTLLGAGAILLAGSLIGAGIVVALVFTAYVIHAALRSA